MPPPSSTPARACRIEAASSGALSKRSPPSFGAARPIARFMSSRGPATTWPKVADWRAKPSGASEAQDGSGNDVILAGEHAAISVGAHRDRPRQHPLQYAVTQNK